MTGQDEREALLTIGEMADAWMAHLGYTPDQIAEAKAWTPPSARLQPEESQEFPQAVKDMDMACDFAREIVLPRLASAFRRPTPHVVTTVALSGGEDVGASLTACVVCGSDAVAHQGVVHYAGRVMVASWCASKECDDDRRLAYPSGLLPATVLTPAPAPADREALVAVVARALRVAAQEGDDRIENATDAEWGEVYDSTLQIIAAVAGVITEVSGTPESIARAAIEAIEGVRRG